MQQHPIPQNVSQYEFHLIGNMTIKQFLEVGAGIGIAVLIYASGIPSFVQWPLIFISVTLGAALAFLPYDGRPLDRMIILFFQATYTPTKFIWKKSATPPDYFNFTAKKASTQSATEVHRTQLRKNLNQYLETLPQETSDLDQAETNYVTSINQLFESTPAAVGVTPSGKDVTIKPSSKIRIRKMRLQKNLKTLPPAPPQTPVKIQTTEVPTATTPQTATTPLQTQPQPSVPNPLSGVNSSLSVPTHAATTNQNLPFPSTPQTPNTIVGMVLDSQGKIVENAIVEVRDEGHMPVRALKTNQLGQFFSATSLKNGQYELEIEKPGLTFDLLSLDLTGQILKPLDIRSQNPLQT